MVTTKWKIHTFEDGTLSKKLSFPSWDWKEGKTNNEYI